MFANWLREGTQASSLHGQLAPSRRWHVFRRQDARWPHSQGWLCYEVANLRTFFHNA